ncbi:uncharacterized protein LOC123274573 [Cotesia glomerata]|uniref:Platelet-derived growth factor (PDGF) family profile domain-containing protein n=1 Tax=Cotesia glomerata TaxID=32391 RepID=A0AAV7HQ42_COTGL|nr:uncharacterized protein LOC123274573 [Cotesia glomerata]KAH0533752.1 hypothetical protein KQX54_001307 [Cotesia glomerata]
MAKNIIKVLRVIILITTILCKIQETQSNQSTTRKNRTSGSSPRSALRLPAVERARKFICTEPQPRAYHLKDLMDSQGLLHSQEAPNHPSYLVVRRCDEHSGCCPSPELVCMPAEGSVYFEEFDVQFRSVDTKKTSHKRISVEQHHNCSCEPANRTQRETLETRRPKITVVS